MTNRPFLMNSQIKLAARKIAHGVTRTCKPRPTEDVPEPEYSADDEAHTRKCNRITRHIMELGMHIKLASLQPSQVEETNDATLPPEDGGLEDEKPKQAKKADEATAGNAAATDAERST